MQNEHGSPIDASNPDHPIQIAEKIWWVGHILPDDPFQCHVYLIENGNRSVLIDPGSMLTFNNSLKKIEEITPFRNIQYFICHHQDPDITSALTLIDKRIRRDDAVIVSHWRAIALLKHYGLKLPLWCVEKNGWTLDLGDRELEFIFTPYLHFPGAFCTFDRKTGTLFSSDLFGGFTENWGLVAEDENYLESIKPFHEHYMPSREILFNCMCKLEKYPIKLIAPQHGSIIPENLIGFIIDQLKNLDCGLYLMTHTSTDIMRLTNLNKILRSFLESMVLYKDFKEISRQCLVQVQKVLPVINLQFYAITPETTIIHLAPESLIKGKEVSEIPVEFQEIWGLNHKEWLNRFGSLLYISSEKESEKHLVIPLFDPENQTMRALAILCLSRAINIDQETGETIAQISLPLGVAVEREIIYRSLEIERQKFYEQSIRDPLTNLYTRLYMRDAVERLFNIHDRDSKASVGIISLDIDHFKSINDTYGHNAGDQVLETVADIIVQETRSGDIQVRMGGEEFAVFVVSNKPRLLIGIAESIRKQIAGLSFDRPMQGRKFSISGGVVIRRQEEILSDAIHRADLALYEAKNSGRNKVCAKI